MNDPARRPGPASPLPDATVLAHRQVRAADWFATLRDRICAAFEAIEDDLAGTFVERPAGRFERSDWQRPDAAGVPGGGGTMAVMRGRVFEKVGVNVSVVEGTFSESFRNQIPGAGEDGQFWAAGVSLVAHLHSPLVPAAHMNTRHIVTSRGWFGGGGDLNPMYPDDADTAAFHGAFEAACDAHDRDYYARYKAWCDDYFFIRHRGEARGVGGIFYDYLDSGDWDDDFAFTRAVGAAFLEAYPTLVRRHMDTAWNDEQRAHQLKRRGWYAEYNLLYDRGTRFGLETGGNVEAILMSLPPLAAWP